MSSGVTKVTALVRLAHPLPTLLNAAVAAALSTVAGARADQAALAAATMLGIHACIGSLNDYFDRHRDAGRAEKPLARAAVFSLRHSSVRSRSRLPPLAPRSDSHTTLA